MMATATPITCWQHGDYPKRLAMNLARCVREKWERHFHRANPEEVNTWLYPIDPVFHLSVDTAATCILPAFRLAIAMGIRDVWFADAADCDLTDRAALGWAMKNNKKGDEEQDHEQEQEHEAFERHLLELDALLAERPTCVALLGYKAKLMQQHSA